MGKLIYVAITFALEHVFARILLALGISLVAYKGLDVAVSAGLNQLKPLLSDLPSNVLNLMALSGFFEALSIVCSAYLTAALITAAKSFVSVAK